MCHIHPVFTAPPDVVLLDLDGTLTDAAPGILACLRHALDAQGIAHPDDATLRTFLGPPLTDTFARLGLSADPTTLAAPAAIVARLSEVYTGPADED